MENYSSYDVKFARRVNFHKDDEIRIEFTELGTIGRKALISVRCLKGYWQQNLMNFCYVFL